MEDEILFPFFPFNLWTFLCHNNFLTAYKFFIDVASISFYIFPCKLIFDTIYNEVNICGRFMNITSLSLFNQQPRKCLKCIGLLGSSVTIRIQLTQTSLLLRVQFVMSVISINNILLYLYFFHLMYKCFIRIFILDK